MPRKKASHEDYEDEDELQIETAQSIAERTGLIAPQHTPPKVTPGTLVKYFVQPSATPLAAFVASVGETGVNLMVLEQSGTTQNATDVPFVSSDAKAPPHPDKHFCTLP